MKSKRKDSKGHWPAGKRRHEDVVKWSRVRLQLTRLLADKHKRGVISARAVAADVGVSDRTIRRYLSGEDRPSPATQRAIAQWVAER